VRPEPCWLRERLWSSYYFLRVGKEIAMVSHDKGPLIPAALTEANLEARDFRLDYAARVLQAFHSRRDTPMPPDERASLQEDLKLAGECDSMGPCECHRCACRRNKACVMYGPNKGTRAVFWHPTIWPKLEKSNAFFYTCFDTCYHCGDRLERNEKQWLCEDRRKAARATTTMRLSPYSMLRHTRQLTHEEKTRDIRVGCKLEMFACPRGCDAESVQKWQEYFSLCPEVTPEGMATHFKSDHPNDKGFNLNAQYHSRAMTGATSSTAK
jgi:hypothetical protein